MSHTTCDCTQAARDAETDIWPNPSAGQLLAAAIAKAADGMGLTSSLLARPAPSEPADASQPLGDVPASERPREAVLPRRIAPEDVRVGMIVERRKGEHYVGGRVKNADGFCSILLDASDVVWAYGVYYAKHGWSLWLIEDVPAPVDPDAELVECMAKEVHDRNCADVSCRDWDGHGESTRKAWRDDARFVIRNLRAQGFDVTPRAEQ